MNELITTLAEMRSTVWAIVPEYLDRLLARVATADAMGSVDRTTQGDADPYAVAAKRLPSVRGTIGVLPLRGVITQRGFGGLLGMLIGGASTEAYGEAFDRLIADEDIGAVVLDIGSPGGVFFGTPELHVKIRNGREIKPVVAVANSLALSAAYYIASAASQVAVIPSGQVGSIGVFSMHVDTTAAEEAEGVKVTIVKAGKYKAENMEPLTDAAREAMQQQVDTYYDTFVADVAKGRGVAPKVVRETYGEGRVVLAKDALAAGMVDRIATLEEVLRGMQASGRSNGRGTAVRTMAITPELCARLGGGIQAVVSEELPQDIRVVGARCLDPGADANVEGERVIEIDLESGEFSADISNPLPAPMIRRYFPSVAHSETSLLAVNLLEALSEYGDIHAAFDQPKLLGALQAALMDCRLPKETPKRDAATQGIRLMDMEAGEGNGEEVTG